MEAYSNLCQATDSSTVFLFSLFRGMSYVLHHELPAALDGRAETS